VKWYDVHLSQHASTVVDGEKPGVDSRDEEKHAGGNDLLFVEKMM